MPQKSRWKAGPGERGARAPQLAHSQGAPRPASRPPRRSTSPRGWTRCLQPGCRCWPRRGRPPAVLRMPQPSAASGERRGPACPRSACRCQHQPAVWRCRGFAAVGLAPGRRRASAPAVWDPRALGLPAPRAAWGPAGGDPTAWRPAASKTPAGGGPRAWPPSARSPAGEGPKVSPPAVWGPGASAPPASGRRTWDPRASAPLLSRRHPGAAPCSPARCASSRALA
mmetsp:Transcript_36042/g.107724  ORF Transcript_36042/g.107724 Transcript_36042/m.107724 type:complete len:226 (-) Transcript_36042:347-1024(-)